MNATITHIAVFLAVAILVVAGAATAESANSDGIADMVSVAIMPIANYTDNPDALTDFGPAIDSELVRQNFNLISSTELRTTLRKYRIRALGAVNVDDIAKISKETNIKYLLFASVDIYRDGNIPVAGFSARLIDATSMRVVWAASMAADGDDFSGLFGIGRITSMKKLVDRLTRDIFKDLREKLSRMATMPPSENRFAIVMFDNYSDADYGGEIVSQYILTELIARGLDVIEPVILNNVFLENGQAPRGQIDLALLKTLAFDHDIDYVITGSVYRFHAASTESENAGSEIELSGRMLDAAEGRILAVYNQTRDGSRTQAIVKPGNSDSLGKLTGSLVKNMLDSFEKTTTAHMADK